MSGIFSRKSKVLMEITSLHREKYIQSGDDYEFRIKWKVFNKCHSDYGIYSLIACESALPMEKIMIIWCKRGKLHRDNDLPAKDEEGESLEWYQNGLKHRKNGPAVVYHTGIKEYWQDGVFISSNIIETLLKK